MMGRLLGLDIGKKRIGIATSDEARIIAFPHSVYNLNSLDDFIIFLDKLIKEKNIDRVVIGLPRRTDREGETESSVFAREMKKTIEERLNIDTVLYDERLSTVEARRDLTSMGINAKKQKKMIDMAAARIILQAYIDSQR